MSRPLLLHLSLSLSFVVASYSAASPRVPSSLQRAPACRLAANKPVNEFSRTIGVAALGRKATRNLIEATGDECAALAARFDLVSIGSLAANVSLAVVDPRRQRVRTYGSFTAVDVVTKGAMGSTDRSFQLEQSKFETFFIDEELAEVGGGGTFDSEEDESYDEPIESGQIDMGELVAQHMYISISDRQTLELSEYIVPGADGEIVFDTDPDLD